MTLRTMHDVRRAAAVGWFEPAAMRFFGTRLCGGAVQAPGGAYFVTSECCPFVAGSPRLYSVRFCSVAGDVDTIGEFQGYATARAARAAASSLGLRAAVDAMTS